MERDRRRGGTRGEGQEEGRDRRGGIGGGE